MNSPGFPEYFSNAELEEQSQDFLNRLRAPANGERSQEIRYMSKPFPPIPPLRLTGDERFIARASAAAPTVLDFWRWSTADLMSNATRGILAEFIVATALDMTGEIREEWAPVDLTYKGVPIEVKAAGYLQAWGQGKLTAPKFGVTKARYYDRATGEYRGERRRHADLYVFCLHHCCDATQVNPLDLDQWSFYVTPTSLLEQHFPTADLVSLRQLEKISASPVSYSGLREEVDRHCA
jgi:hypothetical protein